MFVLEYFFFFFYRILFEYVSRIHFEMISAAILLGTRLKSDFCTKIPCRPIKTVLVYRISDFTSNPDIVKPLYLRENTG